MQRDAQATPTTQMKTDSHQRTDRVRTLLGLPPLSQQVSSQQGAAQPAVSTTTAAPIELSLPSLQSGWPIGEQNAEEAWIAEEIAAAAAELDKSRDSTASSPPVAQATSPVAVTDGDKAGVGEGRRTASLQPQSTSASVPPIPQPRSHADGQSYLSTVDGATGAAAASDGATVEASEVETPSQTAAEQSDQNGTSDSQAMPPAPPQAKSQVPVLTTVEIPGQVIQPQGAQSQVTQSIVPHQTGRQRATSAPQPQSVEPRLSVPDTPPTDAANTSSVPTPASTPSRPTKRGSLSRMEEMPVANVASVDLLPPPVAAARAEMQLPPRPAQPTVAQMQSLPTVPSTAGEEQTRQFLAVEEAMPSAGRLLSSSAARQPQAVEPTLHAQGGRAEGQWAAIQPVSLQEHGSSGEEATRSEHLAWATRLANPPHNGQASRTLQELRKQIDALTAKVTDLEKARQGAPTSVAQPTVLVRNPRVPRTMETRAFWARSYRGRMRLRI